MGDEDVIEDRKESAKGELTLTLCDSAWLIASLVM